ncbi:MAG: dihydropteroate synthase [Cyclobacteriaceae bacterium]|nr:dihydropteroate synthase [Cyclobacteriaceae bacterium]
MGILNITPDSFYDGGKFADQNTILNQVRKMLEEGADFIDVGGYSSRPGAKNISVEEELGRVVPVIELITKNFPEAILSIDTFRSEVARKSIEAGASMINDISGGELDPKMFETVASLKVPYILMHMRGTPETMLTLTEYEDIIKEMVLYFQTKIRQLHLMGVKDIIIDPGFGFAKTIDQNFKILQHLNYFRILGQPILAGLSRKSMIWRTLETSSENALNGTTALNSIALVNGANILRVHDVKEAVECARLVARLK